MIINKRGGFSHSILGTTEGSKRIFSKGAGNFLKCLCGGGLKCRIWGCVLVVQGGFLFSHPLRQFPSHPPPLQNKNQPCTCKTHSLQKTTAIRISSPDPWFHQMHILETMAIFKSKKGSFHNKTHSIWRTGQIAWKNNICHSLGHSKVTMTLYYTASWNYLMISLVFRNFLSQSWNSPKIPLCPQGLPNSPHF